MRMLVAAAALLLAAPASAAEVKDLGWLSGSWVSETPRGWTEELWMHPRGGVMLGLNRSGKSERASGFEFMRIAADSAGRISFWGSPSGAPAVPFRMTASGPREAVFENPKHDYPQRITYKREGDQLVATVSLLDGSKAQSWTFRRPDEARPSP